MVSTAPSVPPPRICSKCAAESPTAGRCAACGGEVIELQPPEDALIGKTIDDRFEVRALLGQGGMGSVYRAYQRSTDREVAIKVIEPRRMRDQGAIRRFLREAKLASQLSQPNTVSVFDFGHSRDGYLYIVMELVKGRTLDRLFVDEGPLGLERAVRIAVQLCDALEVAHSQSIVHRDLKPANIMVLDDPPGRDLVKVLDFGIAKTPDSEITDSGLLVGTPRYMCPQALAGREAQPDWDLYALGVILIEITTGQQMFQHENLAHLMGQKMVSAVIPAGVPAPLRPIIVSLLAVLPDQRIRSAGELRRRLASLASAPTADPSVEITTGTVELPVPITASELAPKRSSRRAWLALGVLGIAAAGVAVAIVLGSRPSDPPAAAPPAPLAAPAPVDAPELAVTDAAAAAPALAPTVPTPPPPGLDPAVATAPPTRPRPGKTRGRPPAKPAAGSAAPVEDRCKQRPRPDDCAPF